MNEQKDQLPNKPVRKVSRSAKIVTAIGVMFLVGLTLFLTLYMATPRG